MAVALFAKLQTASGFNTFSRRLKAWNEVAPPMQPALFLTQGKEQVNNQTVKMGGPQIHTVNFTVYIYCNNGGMNDATPASALNAQLDAIEACLAPLPGQKQTLDGAVVHAYIVGPIETDEGVLGDQSVAIVPIEVLVAP